jgi:superfamily II DNA/RNA helicase
MKDPLLIDLVGTDTNQIPDRIKNIAVLCNSDAQKHDVIRDFITKNRDKKMLIFTDTKAEAAQFEMKTYAKFMPLHGDLSQSQRQYVMKRYRHADCKDILVATDVAARGLDVNDIDIVV